MKEGAIACPSCRALMDPSRTRCLRCGATLVRQAGAAGRAPAVHRHLRVLAPLAVLALAGGLFWFTGGAGDAAPSPVPRNEPLLESSPPAEPPRPVEAPPRVRQMDPVTEGRSAYYRGDYQAALERFREAAARNPQDADSLANYGRMLVRAGRAGEAVPLFEKAASLRPDRWAYAFDAGHAYGELKDWERAVAAYTRAATLFPGDHVTEFNLGMALHRKGDEAQAVEHLRRAVALAPDVPESSLALGISLEAAGRRAEAADALEQYLQRSPGGPDAGAIKARVARLRSPMSTAQGARAAGDGKAPSGGLDQDR